MTIRDLIVELSKLPPESEVILSSDEEGNNYYALDEVCLGDSSHIVLYPGGHYLDYEEVFGEES